MDLSLEPTMPKTPPLFIFESPYQVQVESFHLSSWTVNGNGLDMLPMAFFLQDDHERVENDQEQLLDAIDEHTFFLKRLNSQMNMKLLLVLDLVFTILVMVSDWLKESGKRSLDGSDCPCLKWMDKMEPCGVPWSKGALPFDQLLSS
ncbi:hypothetical protein YC2023_082234 [Brassica napus]